MISGTLIFLSATMSVLGFAGAPMPGVAPSTRMIPRTAPLPTASLTPATAPVATTVVLPTPTMPPLVWTECNYSYKVIYWATAYDDTLKQWTREAGHRLEVLGELRGCGFAPTYPIASTVANYQRTMLTMTEPAGAFFTPDIPVPEYSCRTTTPCSNFGEVQNRRYFNEINCDDSDAPDGMVTRAYSVCADGLTEAGMAGPQFCPAKTAEFETVAANNCAFNRIKPGVNRMVGDWCARR